MNRAPCCWIRLTISEIRKSGMPMMPAGSHTLEQKTPNCSIDRS